MLDDAKTLLAKAFDDLDFVANDLLNERQRDNVGYHIAHAVEKTLKSICESGDLTYPKGGTEGHMLAPLYLLLIDNGAGWVENYQSLVALSRFNSQSRYQYTEGGNLDLVALFDLAKEFSQEVLRRLNSKGLV